MTIFYFTSTGNCLEVAKKIGGKLISIPSVLKGNCFDFEDDAIGIISPVYGGGLPAAVVDFLAKINIKTNYLFGILTYGAMNLCGNEILQLISLKHNLKFNYINSLIMADNSFIYFDMEKQIANLPKKKVDEHIFKIKQDIDNQINKLKISFLGKIMAKRWQRRQEKRKSNYFENFSIENTCVLCGTCKKVCPIDNIAIEDKVVIGNKCIRCGACYHNCPHSSIRYKNEKSKTQYRNKNVKLNEIITANSNVFQKEKK